MCEIEVSIGRRESERVGGRLGVEDGEKGKE